MEYPSFQKRRLSTPMSLFGLESFRAFSFSDRKHAVYVSGKEKLRQLKQKIALTAQQQEMV